MRASLVVFLPAIAASAGCSAPAANDMLQTLVCAAAQNTLKWSKVGWDANMGGSLQLSGTSLCMQAGPASAAGSFLALQLANCTGAVEQRFASITPSGIASQWVTHVDGNCLDANSGNEQPNEQMETYCACARQPQSWRHQVARSTPHYSPPPPPIR